MRIAALAFLLLATTPAFAGATPWQDVAPGARLRLISSDVRGPDGKTLVGLELDMPDSYKTYWRLPGETGIPTELDTAGSEGIGAATLEWPYPQPEVTQGFLDYVYHGPIVLPVMLATAGAAPLLKAAVTMGVCSEVCVPVRASFTLPLSFSRPDAGQSIRLAQAAALAPIPWNRDTPPFSSAAYDAANHALRLAGTDPAVDAASIIASTDDPTVLFDAPQKSPDGRSLLLPLRGQDRGTAWAAKPIELTFMTAAGSFAIDERVTAPAP